MARLKSEMSSEDYEAKKVRERARWVAWNAKNPGVASSRMKQWKKDNPEKFKAHARKALLKKYGLSIEQFDELLVSQNNACKLCKKLRLPTEREWQVDHCHDTGRVRGILCYNCNVGLGHFTDSPTLLAAAIEYLGKTSG